MDMIHFKNYFEEEIENLKKRKKLLEKKSFTLDELDQLYTNHKRESKTDLLVEQEGGLTHFYQKQGDHAMLMEELLPFEQTIGCYTESYQYPDYFYYIRTHKGDGVHQFVYQAANQTLLEFHSSKIPKYMPYDFLITTQDKGKNTSYLIDFKGNQHVISKNGHLLSDYKRCKFDLAKQRIWLYYYQDRPVYGYASPNGIITCRENLEECYQLLNQQSTADLTELKAQISAFDDTFMACPKTYQKRPFRFTH